MIGRGIVSLTLCASLVLIPLFVKGDQVGMNGKEFLDLLMESVRSGKATPPTKRSSSMALELSQAVDIYKYLKQGDGQALDKLRDSGMLLYIPPNTQLYIESATRVEVLTETELFVKVRPIGVTKSGWISGRLLWLTFGDASEQH